jgi:hypothetical protein
MATRKTKAPKRAGAAKGARGMAKKSKQTAARKKTRPAAKSAGRKAAKKAVKRPAKAARKIPAKARKTAKPAKAAARKAAPRKVAKKPAVKKAPAKKAEVKRPPAKKAVAAIKPVTAKPAPVRPAPALPAPAGAPPVEAVVTEPAVAQPAAPAAPAKPGTLPAIRPYRGTQAGGPAAGKRGRQKKRTRNRYSKIFAEFETRPAPPERRRKRRVVDDEDEDTSISVLRERPRLQIETPEQIRVGVLKRYLETGQPSCPVGCGGIAEVVRVGTLEDGTGEVWIECLSCAQRERFLVPRATPAERQQAQRAMEESGEAMCPRHGRPVQLRRRGRDMVCPECGVLYPEP